MRCICSNFITKTDEKETNISLLSLDERFFSLVLHSRLCKEKNNDESNQFSHINLRIQHESFSCSSFDFIMTLLRIFPFIGAAIGVSAVVLSIIGVSTDYWFSVGPDTHAGAFVFISFSRSNSNRKFSISKVFGRIVNRLSVVHEHKVDDRLL